MAIPANRKSDSEKPSLGNVAGICIGIYGFQGEYKGNVSNKVLYLFEIDERLTKGQYAGKRHLVSTRFPNFISPPNATKKSNLTKMLVGWKGAIPEGDFDLEADVGRPAMLNLVLSDDGQYVNIGAVTPMPKGMSPITRETQEDYVPEWIKILVGQGATEKTSDWTPEVEDQPVDPLTAKRADLHARTQAIWKSGVFPPTALEEMNAKLLEHKGALPSQEFLIKGWEEQVKAGRANLDKIADGLFEPRS